MTEVETLHRPFERFLRDAKIPFIRARSDRESTIAVGHPDFTLLCKSACLMIEFKHKGGELSKEQRDRIAELQAAGNKVYVIRDIDAAIEIVTTWRSTLRESITAVRIPGRIIHRIGSSLWEEKDGQLSKLTL